MSAVHQFQPIMPFSVPAFAATLFALGLALGTTIAVGMLFFIQVCCLQLIHPVAFFSQLCEIQFNNITFDCWYSFFQMKVILRNKTSIESWIEEKVQTLIVKKHECA